MKSFKTLFILIFLFVNSFSVFSQTQSLWSEIRKSNADSVGLSALQYQVPLVGEIIDFFDMEKIKVKNNWAGCHTWLVRDFNLDGFADIFLAFFSDEIEAVPFMLLIYDKNTGTYIDQSFRIKNNIGETFNRKTMAADFNGDGILDIVAISNPEKPEGKLSHLDVLLSNPDTTWTQKRLKEVDRLKGEGYYHGVAVGDLDNDGNIDIVLGVENNYFGGSLSLINDGNGNFTEKQVTSIDRGLDFETCAWTTELADINKDGCLDLMYWHDDLNTRILYGNCTETFDYAYQDFGSLEYPYIMDYDVRDFDGDGDYDLLLTTTDYFTGWQLVFRENKDIDNEGKVIWADNSEVINQSLKTEGFYTDSYSYEWVPYVDVVDINSDGFYDIIPQKPLSKVETFNQWILLGDNNWKFKYKKLPFAEPPKIITSEFTNSGKIKLLWERVKQDYSTSDGGIDKWAIYISDNIWGDRSQVSSPIIVSSSDTKSENGFDHVLIEPTSKEMYIRISPIDSSGIEWPLSEVHKITINPPTIASASICDGKTLTITGSNFIGVQSIDVGNSNVISYSVLSESILQAELNTGQTGNVYLKTVGGNSEYSDITNITAPLQPFLITGKKLLLSGSTEIFSVPNIQGISYIWSLPDDWELITGSNTNSVTVKVGTSSGDVNVYPSVICGSVSYQNITTTVYTFIPDDNFQNALRNLGIDRENKPDSVLTSSLIGVATLDVDSMNIADLTGIQDFAELKSLKCRKNKLTKLDLTGNRLLEELFCGYNKMTSIDLSKNIALKILSCEWNQISILDVSQNTMLNFLGCDGIPITSLNLSNNKELALISIYGQDIKFIDLSNNTKLSYFSCVDCRLTELDVSKNVHLDLLNCSGNQLTSVDISNNPALTFFGCSDNKLFNLNLMNGNNPLINTFFALNNPNLTCINVDNPELANTYTDWTKDATATYSDNCIKTDIEQNAFQKSIKVYPNPITDELIIENLSGSRNNDFEIINAFGQSVLHGKFNEKTIIKTDLFKPGIYVVRLKSGEMVKFEKVVKQ